MFGFSCAEWTIPNVLIRIVVSMILGCVIGLDRGLKNVEQEQRRIRSYVWEQRWLC